MAILVFLCVCVCVRMHNCVCAHVRACYVCPCVLGFMCSLLLSKFQPSMFKTVEVTGIIANSHPSIQPTIPPKVSYRAAFTAKNAANQGSDSDFRL